MEWRALVVLSLLLTASLLPSHARAQDATLCAPPVDIHRANVCLPATQVRQAERLVPIAVDPTGVVWSETHLGLTQVVLRGGMAHPFGIVYVYGHLPAGKSGAPDFGLSRPKYMTVGEIETNRGTGNARPRLSLLAAPAAWHFGAVVLKRRWALDLTSNVRKGVVRRMGWTLVGAAERGK